MNTSSAASHTTKAKKSTKGILSLLGLLFFTFLVGGQLHSQGLNLNDRLWGSEQNFSKKFTRNGESYTFSIRHRLASGIPVKVTLLKASRIRKSAYRLNESLPFVLKQGESKDLTFTINYSKYINRSTEVLLKVEADGDATGTPAENKIILVKLNLSAEGKVYFWDNPAGAFRSSLDRRFTTRSNIEREQFFEIRRNGSGRVKAVVLLTGDASRGFTILPADNPTVPLRSGDTLRLSEGVKSFLVRYDPDPGKKNYEGALVIRSIGQSPFEISCALHGGTGDAVVASTASDIEGFIEGSQVDIDYLNGTIKGGDSSQKPDSVLVAEAKAREEAAARAARNPKDTTITARFEDKLRELTYQDYEKLIDSLCEGESFIALTDSFFGFIETGKDTFQTDIKIDFTRLLAGFPRLSWEPENAFIVVADTDTVMLDIMAYQRAELAPMQLRMLGRNNVESGDTFQLNIAFIPYGKVEGVDRLDPRDIQPQLTSYTPGQLVLISNAWIYWLIFAGAVLLFILFSIRSRLAKPIPVPELKYRTPPRKKNTLDAKAITLDLNRPEKDIILLEFEGEKLEAKVAGPPIKRGRKILKRIFLLSNKKNQYAFDANYYSFRIEPEYENMPRDLKFRDKTGFFLLGTDMTGDILSTDHQDFTLTKQEVTFRVFIDPTEIIDVSGGGKEYQIPFKVVEEPFERYTRTNRFILPLTVTARRRVIK